MTPKKTSAVSRCLIWVRGLPLERYRLPNDTRKWREVARNRQGTLNFLAGFANRDGTFQKGNTNYSPGLTEMMKHFGLSHQWLIKLLNDLRRLGLLDWTRDNRHERREYTINISEGNYSSNPDCNYSNPDCNCSRSAGLLSATVQNGSATVGVSDCNCKNDNSNDLTDMSPHPSLPSKEPSKEGAENQSANPSFSEPKASGQGKPDAVILSDIKNWAWDACREAKFKPKSDGLIKDWLRDNPGITHDAIQKTVRLLVQQMDDFELKDAGGYIASNLDRAIHDPNADAAYAARQKREEAMVDAQIAELKRKSDARRAEIRAREARPKPTAEELFGG